MKGFYEMVRSLLEHNIVLDQKRSTFEEFKILKNECIYVIDYNQNSLLYKKGFENVLGYKDEEMNLTLLSEGYHLEDKAIISKVMQESILHTLKDPTHGKDNTLLLKYRHRRKDGRYNTVLSQTHIYDLDSEGNRLKTMTRLTDISFANDFTKAGYSFRSQNLDKHAFDRVIHKAFFNFFTKREHEVIQEMFKRSTNKEISETLFISRHTVATHRKNIFRKSGCSTVDELMIFCEAKGIFRFQESEF